MKILNLLIILFIPFIVFCQSKEEKKEKSEFVLNFEKTPQIKQILITDGIKYLIVPPQKIYLYNDSLIEQKKIKSKISYCFVDNGKEIWYANYKNKISTLSLEKDYIFDNDSISTSVSDIEFFDNEIWLATDRGVKIINKANGKDLNSDYNFSLMVDYLNSNYVNSIHQDENEEIWIATNGGLFKYSNNNLEFIDDKNAPEEYIFDIDENEKYIFFAGQGRLYKLSKEEEKWEIELDNSKDKLMYTILGEELRKIETIYDIEVDYDNNLWLASNVIARYDVNNKWTAFDLKNDSIKCTDAICITTEKNKDSKIVDSTIVWIGTINNGLWKIEDKTVGEFTEQKNLVFFIDASVTNKSYFKDIKCTFKLWSEFLDKDDKISIVSVYRDKKNSQKRIDTVVVDAVSPKDFKIIKNGVKSINESGYGFDSITLYKTIEIVNQNYIENGNNRIIFFSDGISNSLNKDSLIYLWNYKAISSDFLLFSNQKNSPLEYFAKTVNGQVFYSKEGKGTILSKFFDYDFIPKPFIFFISSFYQPSFNYLHENKINEGSLSTNFKDNKYSFNNLQFIKFDLIYDCCFPIKIGFGVSLEQNKFNTNLLIEDYQYNYPSKDKDDENYVRYIYGNDISEKAVLKNLNIPVFLSLNFKGFYLAAGFKFQIKNKINSDYNGIFTYQGAYERYGGEILKLHDLQDYDFVTNFKYSDKTKFKLNSLKNKYFFYEIGYRIQIIKYLYLSINYSATYLSGFELTNKNPKSFVLSEGPKKYNSVLETFSFKSDIIQKISIGISYNLNNFYILNWLSKF